MQKQMKCSRICKICIFSIIFSIVCLFFLYNQIFLAALFGLGSVFTVVLSLMFILSILLPIIAIISGFIMFFRKKEIFGLIALILGICLVIAFILIALPTAYFLLIISLPAEEPANIGTTITDFYYTSSSGGSAYKWHINITFENKEDRAVSYINYPHFITNSGEDYGCETVVLDSYNTKKMILPYSIVNITFESCDYIDANEKPEFFKFNYAWGYTNSPFVKLNLEYLDIF